MKPLPKSISRSEQAYWLEFTGSASEYFRICIINIFLTVITLGIYNAWAKVRTRQYFYAHTLLDGHAFDYLANPIAILKGNLIIASGFILFVMAQQFALELYGVIVLGFYALTPYLIYKSLRFRAHNSAYRNIRLHFHGSAGESYRIYFWWSLLIPLTLGLILPYIIYREKRYVFDHIAYGTTRSRFNGSPRSFYQIYLVVLGISLLGVAISIALSYILTQLVEDLSGRNTVIMSMLIIAGYLALIFIVSLIQQYIYAQSSNYCWHHSTLGPIRFISSLKTWPLVRMQIINLLAIICSLGLLIPWARIRRTRYLMDHIRFIVEGDLNQFTAVQDSDEHALGDVSADFFDIEVGL